MAGIVLTAGRAQLGRRLRLLATALSLAGLLGLGMAAPGQAAGSPPPQLVAGLGSVGECTLSGTVTFGSSVTAAPANTAVGVTVSGSCLGFNTSPQVLAGYQAGSILMSCEAGAGTTSANEQFSTGAPPAPSGTGFLVAGPGTIEITIVSGVFIGVVTLVWSNPVATATCPLSGSGTNPIRVTGVMVFEYGT